MPTHRLALVFAAIIASFVAATAFVHWQMRVIDGAAVEIADNAAPSIEHLSAARVEARQLQVLLSAELERLERGEAFDPTAIEEARRAMSQSVEAYLALPSLPDERKIWTQVFRALAATEEDLTHFHDSATRNETAAAAAIVRQHLPARLADLNEALMEGVRVDAGHAGVFARQIQASRARTSKLALALDAVCTFIAIGGAILIRRLMREHAALVESHRRLHEERASELEDFAGRIAHDILSPLGTVAFALSLSGTQEDAAQRRRLLERGTSAVERIKKLVNGLLDFARAGGKPSEGSQADLDAVMRDIVAELEPAATKVGAQLVATHDGNHTLACNPGVLTSLIANLARNAIKYLGDSPVRKVEIRARERGSYVRVEVADTGPGLPPDIEKRVFEPYIRARNATQPGFGLGLATVKRLAEAHGGKVGVESAPGLGSTFWFELPKAAPLRDAMVAQDRGREPPKLAQA